MYFSSRTLVPLPGLEVTRTLSTKLCITVKPNPERSSPPLALPHGNRVDYILTHEPSGKANGYLSLGTPVNGVNLLLNPLEEQVHFTRWYFAC